jgi:hypothetical protein
MNLNVLKRILALSIYAGLCGHGHHLRCIELLVMTGEFPTGLLYDTTVSNEQP